MSCRIIAFAFTILLASSGVIVFAKPPNDRCIDSITLVAGEMVIGDNSEANFDYNSQGVCGARSDRRALWYEINGIGKEATINVCTNNEKKTDFGIFRACNTQNCLGAPPQQIDAADCDAGESNEYIFLAEEGESYYIHVRSDVLFEGEGSNFTIWYTEPTDEPTSTPVTDAPVSVPDGPTSSGSDSSRRHGAMLFYNIAISAVVAGLGYVFVCSY